jgi:hypothetical protein
MTKAKRTALSYAAEMKGGRPRLIDRDKMLKLRAAGKLHQKIAEDFGVSMASVARILRRRKIGRRPRKRYHLQFRLGKRASEGLGS